MMLTFVLPLCVYKVLVLTYSKVHVGSLEGNGIR